MNLSPAIFKLPFLDLSLFAAFPESCFTFFSSLLFRVGLVTGLSSAPGFFVFGCAVYSAVVVVGHFLRPDL